MANAGTFKKGEKKPNQGKRGPNKATVQVREAIAIFAEANVDRLQGWLDEIASNDKQGPAVAARLYLDLLEYHVPKLARSEVSGPNGGPVETISRIELVPMPDGISKT